MRRFLALVLLAAAGLVGGCAGPGAGESGARVAVAADGARPAATAAPAAPTVDGPRIVFLGDSLARGLGLAPDEAVPALIQRRLDAAGYDYRVVNRGNSGDTSASGLRQLDDALEGDARIVVLELGANDMLRGLGTEQLEANLRAIIERCRAEGIDVLLAGMEALPNYGADYTGRFRQVYTDLAAEYDLAFMPFFLYGVAGDPDLNQADMRHPNTAGARIVADNLWRYLEPMLE